ncbi:MAG: site-specific DNA-methyltransferase [Candidatus Lokiarchaeota archaeon]|nr:site-specific DNA-methyltransferase [Candidatus Harpocratesius repetitus]
MLFLFAKHIIYNGDVYASLQKIKDNSIDCAITSPPYWSQRNYGFENQIGNEKTLDEYFEKLLSIYSLLRKKINNKGIFFHNIGDKYINKYGNKPLGMIPYKLAYFMVQEGWILEDIIIWYKPNHMPSSVKNRFTNTYEPVFVFAKIPDNYYRLNRKLNNSSNILKINLQTISYAHMATFPEKLVESLLKLGLPKNATILDPFAGAGTTCKAVQNLNERNNFKMKSIMIEAKSDYVSIMMKRCNIKNENIIGTDYIPYEKRKIIDKISVSSNNITYDDINPKSIIIKHLKTQEEFNEFIPNLFNNDYSDNLDDDGLLFIILPDHDIEKVYSISKAKRWIIRNMLVIPTKDKKDWVPIFFLVKDTKMVRYQFQIDNIRINHLHKIEENWRKVNFLGYKVIKSQSITKNPQNGIIIKVIGKYSNGLPKWVVVKWEDSSNSIEEIINPSKKAPEIIFFCPYCNKQLIKYHLSRKKIICSKCNNLLWRKGDIFSIPKLKLEQNKKPPIIISEKEMKIVEKQTKRDYNGKFKDVERINMGQSPGARASVSEQYFSMQRYYKVKQSMFCDYLNIHRENMGLSKNELTNLFPPEYKHTVGHWLRKDMGGSLPKIEDLLTLQKILHLDDVYVQFVNRFGLKLQTVMANSNGKNPGDYLEMNIPDLKEMFEKLVD